MVTSPLQHVFNFMSIRKMQRKTRQDEVNNASSVQDATPASSVQDATHTQRTRRRNNKRSKHTDISVHWTPAGADDSYWCNARGVGTVDRGNRPTRGDFQKRFQQWPTLKRTPDMEEHDIDEPSAAACKRTKEPRYCSQSISGVVDGGISREGSHKGQMYSKLNSTCEMP